MGVQTDLREKLISDYAKLSPQMQKAARYILDHPNDVALRSMRALARAANVPPSTVTRLMSAIGVENWRDFRDHYQDRLLDNPASYAQRARETQRTRQHFSLPMPIGCFVTMAFWLTGAQVPLAMNCGASGDATF